MTIALRESLQSNPAMRLSFADPDGGDDGGAPADASASLVLKIAGNKRLRKKDAQSSLLAPPRAAPRALASTASDRDQGHSGEKRSKHEDWKTPDETPEVVAARAARAESKSAASTSTAPPMSEREEGDAQREFEYAYYDADEGQGLSEFKERTEELESEKVQQRLARASHGLRGNTPRATEIMRDNSRWESSLLERSGVTHRAGAVDDIEEEEERVRLIVKDLRPPFLDGRVTFSTQTEQVSVVRDPTSDMAVIARKGSAAVQALRIKRERQKTTQKFWELAGSKMGTIMGIKDEEREAEQAELAAEDPSNVDYRADSQCVDLSPSPSPSPLTHLQSLQVCHSHEKGEECGRVSLCAHQDHAPTARVSAHLCVQGASAQADPRKQCHRGGG